MPENAVRGAAEVEATYSLGAVVRLTGLSPHVLRAWERRYGAVTPKRTPGGTRRYRESDVARLQLLRAAVQAGHPIGDVARLPEKELRRRATAHLGTEPRPALGPLLDAIERLDVAEAERLLGLQLSALGPRRFAVSVVEPLLREVGERWARGQLCIAAEHVASALTRTLLGAILQPKGFAARQRPILFTTAAGNRHEIGALVCAVVAADLGANALYLGPDLPVEEVGIAARSTSAAAVAVGLAAHPPRRERQRAAQALRRALPAEVALWLGGPGSAELPLPPDTARIADLDELEQRIALIGARRSLETG